MFDKTQMDESASVIEVIDFPNRGRGGKVIQDETFVLCLSTHDIFIVQILQIIFQHLVISKVNINVNVNANCYFLRIS